MNIRRKLIKGVTHYEELHEQEIYVYRIDKNTAYYQEYRKGELYSETNVDCKDIYGKNDDVPEGSDYCQMFLESLIISLNYKEIKYKTAPREVNAIMFPNIGGGMTVFIKIDDNYVRKIVYDVYSDIIRDEKKIVCALCSCTDTKEFFDYYINKYGYQAIRMEDM